MKQRIDFDGTTYWRVLDGKRLEGYQTYAEAERALFTRMKFSSFSGLPAIGGKQITEPVQVYEDSPFWNSLRDS